MTDKDKCSRATELFYQHIADQTKKNPDFAVEDILAYAYEWALNCGFEHPRCFVKYIEDAELDRMLEQTSNPQSE